MGIPYRLYPYSSEQPDRVVQSSVKEPRVDAKFESRYESLESKFSFNMFFLLTS